MKRITLFLAALVVTVALSSSSVKAQGVSFHIGGGIAMGAGDLSDNTETGWMGFAGLDLPIASMPGLNVGATASYAHIPFEGESDAATNITALLGELSYAIGATSSSPFKPYVRGGVGLVRQAFSSGYGGDSESENKVGFGGGAGILYAMRQVSPFFGVHYFTSGSEASYYTVYAGISISSGGGTAAAIRKAVGR
ncbi:MAG: outer membrane beta-barrel protein [Gemmatimonadaceae bacterium]